MKRTVLFLLVFLLLFIFVSCGVTPELPQQSTSGTVETEAELFSPDFPEALQQYCAPWRKDAPAEAISDGNIHYYFMSSLGMLIDPEESDPYKWGDSALIVFPTGQTMLVDVGMEAYAPVLAENLRRMGIDRLDYLLLSHPHSDHIGGIIAEDSFLDMVNVDKVLYSGIDRGEKSDLLYSRCAERNIPIQIIAQGDVMEFGPVRMEVLWPLPGTDGKVITRTEPINNQSIVVRFDYKEHTSLFVGDLYAGGEAAVVDSCWNKLDVDLLKVPHHGYSTSSSGVFIHLVSPEIAVSMGAYTPAIQMRYEALGSTFLYDRYEGYIHVRSDGTGMRYETNRTIP